MEYLVISLQLETSAKEWENYIMNMYLSGWMCARIGRSLGDCLVGLLWVMEEWIEAVSCLGVSIWRMRR